MVGRVKRIPPALKHGAYSATTLLPGEDPAEFEKLHQELIAELKPSGALGDDAVATIARLIWRKRNLTTCRIAQLTQARYRAIKYEIEWSNGSGDIDAAVEDQAREELGDTYELVDMGDAATLDGLTTELDILERLDALIDRGFKRFAQVKGLKSILTASSSAPPPRIAGPSRVA
jgi:hypothetical protein